MKKRRNSPDTEAEIAYRSICEGEAEVARQREVLLKLYYNDRPAEVAEERLKEFESELHDRRKHLA